MDALNALLADVSRSGVDTFEYQLRWGIMAVCALAALGCLLPGLVIKRRRGNYNWLYKRLRK